jgi:hypothetical protein
MAKKILKKAQMGTSTSNVKSAALESMKGGAMQASEERKRRASADSLQKNINNAAVTQGLQPNLKANAGMMKAGGMIKRADGSTSQRGLWDNIRANKGSGKKPTSEMLKQEKKIKAKKAEDGTMLKSKSVKTMPVNAPKLKTPPPTNDAMGPSGTVLDNVNVRPSRWQTAKRDASYITRESLKPLKSSLKGNIGDKLKAGLFTAGMSAMTPQNVAASAFNVISGQSRYNKNKRAGLERGKAFDMGPDMKKNGGKVAKKMASKIIMKTKKK